MTQSISKWRVAKKGGRWLVRRPDGGHFGTFFTWREAMAQVRSRLVDSRGACGGSFDRRGSWDYDDRVWSEAFGFCGPVRCDDRKAARS